jgi:holin-like protein
MIAHLTLLLVFQLAGELLRNALGLVVPGPVIGMALLLVVLVAVPRLAAWMRDTAQGLLGHLSLLFVPAGVGVVGHLDRLGSDGLALLIAIAASTVLAILAAVGAFLAVARLTGNRDA